jgi:hypothetical protein
MIEQLTNYHVWHLYWLKNIQIEPALSSQAIMAKQEEIYQCAKAYKQHGMELNVWKAIDILEKAKLFKRNLQFYDRNIYVY